MSDREEYADLEGLTTHDGWKRFTAHAMKTWDDEFSRRTIEAIGGQPLSDEQTKLALDRLRQAAAIREELRSLLKWPERRMGELNQAERMHQMPVLSRRGGL